MAHAFAAGVIAALLLLSQSARAGDTALVGRDLLERCEGTPELKKADQLYCKGYLGALEDMVDDAKSRTGSAAFCVPTAGVNDEQLRQAYVVWAKTNPSELRQSALKAAMAALEATYPCGK